MVNIHVFLECLAATKMIINLTKSYFGHAYIIYLGHVVGQVRPRDAKVKCILEYTLTTNKKELMGFFGRLQQNVLSSVCGNCIV